MTIRNFTKIFIISAIVPAVISGCFRDLGNYDYVEVNEAFVLDLGDQVSVANHHRAGFLSGLGGIALADGDNANVAAGTVRQHNSAADLLVSVAAVNAQADVQLNGLVKLGLCGLAAEGQRLLRVVNFGTVDQLSAFGIFLTVIHYSFLLCGGYRINSSHVFARSHAGLIPRR